MHLVKSHERCKTNSLRYDADTADTATGSVENGNGRPPIADGAARPPIPSLF